MLAVNMLRDGTVIESTDANLVVRFFLHPIQDEVKSKEEGRPIYREVEMVEIIAAGSRDKLHRQVREEDKYRFKARYEAFKNASSNAVEGTLLNQFPFISAAEVKELEYFNIFTGEQLVSMSDGNIDKMGVNGRDLIKKVKAYMQMAKDTSVVSRMTEENEHLKREMNLLKEQMQQILTMKDTADEGKARIRPERHHGKAKKDSHDE